MAGIELQGVTKIFPDGTVAVRSVSLEIPDGKLVVLVGPSGCGKTTLLRMIAGLVAITEGVVRISGEPVNDVPAKNRDIAMVFQNYALYPHMTVYDNMAFALRRRRVPRAAIRERVTRTAETLGIVDQLHKKPRALSGGQRQRVAMGRAIVREPKAFLMDEPLSNLDAKLRVQVRAEIGRLPHAHQTTTVDVTHDQVEAMTLGDVVAVMRQGEIQQVAPPQAMFERPANLFVAGFIGSPAMNFVEARIEREANSLAVSMGRFRFAVPPEVLAARPRLARYEGRAVVLGIRPEDFTAGGADPRLEQMSVRVELRETLGREAYLHFRIDAPPAITDQITELAADTDAASLDRLQEQESERTTHFIARVSAYGAGREGGQVVLAVDPRNFHFFDVETGEALYGDASSIDDNGTRSSPESPTVTPRHAISTRGEESTNRS
jgi:multiple sugar transport system ATP-binding protein